MTGPIDALDGAMRRGLVAFRWLALGWACAGVALERDHLDRLWLAILLLAAAAVVTTLASRRVGDPTWARSILVVELAVGCALLVADAAVYDAARAQSLAWAWPAAGIMAVALSLGVAAALAAAGLIGTASLIGESLLRDELQWTSSTASKTALLVLAAVAAARIAAILRLAEREISAVRAREDVARVLHDGVLQTLAVVQRRSGDADLRALASEQERDLRSFLFEGERPPESLRRALRLASDEVARRHGVSIDAVIADDLPELSPHKAGALAGAVREALTNSAKHSGATSVSLYAEPADSGGVYCSVRDDGRGFDPEEATAGRGLSDSVRARVNGLGGRVEITSAPSRGTEVEMWLS